MDRWIALLALLMGPVLLLGAGCDEAAKRPTVEKESKISPPPSARSGTHIVQSLLKQAARAELSTGGLLINLGTPDQHKYTLGGWRTGWSDASDTKGLYLRAKRKARLSFVDWSGDVKAVVIRTRAVNKGQTLGLQMGQLEAGVKPLSEQWEELTFELDKPLEPGRLDLRLSFKHADNKGHAAEVDWVWLKTGTQPRPDPVKVATLTLGGPRRALKADPPRTLTYYLQVPKEAALVFDYAGAKGTRFAVKATVDGSAPQELFSTKVKAAIPRWQEARVDLTALAGKLVRLDLITAGRGGSAGWGEPDLVRSGQLPASPPVRRDQRAKNLLYIMIDTARQDVFKPFNDKTHVKAPALARLAGESTIFTSAYCNSNWTKPSVATIWSGLYPSTHNTKTKSAVLPKAVPVYSEHLRKQGLTTAAFIANGYTSDKFGFKRGWDTYRNYIRQDLPYKAPHVYGDALDWLKKNKDKRFFLYIQAIDPHVPYEPPKTWRAPYYEGEYRGKLGPSVSGYEILDFNQGKKKFTDDDKRYTRALYDAEISYHDHYFGDFLKQVAELGLLEETLVVVSNDHGEEFLEHGKYGHGQSLFEELIRAPLLFRYPPLFPAGKVVKQPVELVDLLPTKLDVLGLPRMKELEGLSLLGAVRGRPALRPAYAVAEYLQLQRAVRLGDYKLIQRHRGQASLFNLAADPGEQEDLAAKQPVARRACEVYLGEALGVPNKAARLSRLPPRRRFDGEQVKMDPDLRRQLRALGYIN